MEVDSFGDHDISPPKADNVKVVVRVRPLNAREKSISINTRYSWKVDSSSVAQCDNGKVIQQAIYSFDSVFVQDSTNSQIFQTIAAPVVKSTVDGINGVIFAYGQTAAGKTYTMLGTHEDPGVTRRAIASVFEHVQEQTNRQFLLRASYIEIYNEVIRDLLVPGSDNLKIHEDVFNKRVFVDAKEEVVMSVDQVMNILATGEKAREVGDTNMNERSSRSHTIFSLKIESREMDPESDQDDVANNGVALRSSTLSLVDLAGSERASFTKAQGQRLVEGGFINKSLLTLGTVINKLSSGVSLSSGHIPYRDSKLTRLLQPALGGNARTAIICAVTPAVLHMDETISTLKFASRAKKVTNMAKANEYLDDRAKLRKAEKKIIALRAELTVLRENGVTAKPGSWETLAAHESSATAPSGRLSEEDRVAAFENMWNKILEAVPPEEVKTARRSEGHRTVPVKEYKRPSLTTALDLSTGRSRVSTTPDRNEVIDDELADLRKKVMDAEKQKRQALSEIEYERQAMSDEVQLLVAGSEDATMGRIAAEQDCDRALSMLAKAQTRSLVDEIVTHAMTKSEATKDLKIAQRKLLSMDKVVKEKQTMKETLIGLRKEHTDAIRREKRGIGPVLKEAKQAQNKVNDLENKLRSAKQANQKMNSEKTGLERDVKDRDRKIKVLTSEVERHRKHEDRVQKRIKEEVAMEKKKLDAVIDKVKAELSSRHAKVDELEQELVTSQKRLEETMQQEKESKDALCLKETEIEKLNEIISARGEENVNLAKSSEILSSKVQNVEKRLRHCEKERDSLESYRIKLEAENLRKGDDLTKKAEQLGEISLKLEETKSELETVRNDREVIREQEQGTRKCLAESETQHDIALHSIEELRQDVEKRGQSLEEAHEKIQKLEERLEKLAGVEESLRHAHESIEKMTSQVSEKQSIEEGTRERIAGMESLVAEKNAELKSLREELEMSVGEYEHLESENQATKNKHDQLVRLVEELERVNAELVRKDCESCVHLRKQLSATQSTDAKRTNGRNEALEEVQNERGKLEMLVEQLTEETATRLREMERLSKTLRKRDTQIFHTQRELDSIRRGEGIVGRLEERVKKRELELDRLRDELCVQSELLRSGGLSERFTNAQRLCAVENENKGLRERNEALAERMRVMELEREEIKDETFKLRDKIKEKDCERIGSAVVRRTARLKEVRERNRRDDALREIPGNQVGQTR